MQQGDRFGGFVVTKIEEIEEIHVRQVEAIHEATGAPLIHLQNEDQENLFCLSLSTRPMTSDGVAHILEHTVLCGSEHYPVKDPFFSMTRRSLNTFMNAFTGADFTCYPASSQVPKDFYNLLAVYLDAVFFPKLEKMSFLQEGHRLEFAEGADPSSPLEYKGIVYNEMKGAMSSPEARLGRTLMQYMFPGNTYGVNSGGEPSVIPELTYEQLVSFHREYYHPSRCLFYFYGNLETERHMAFLEERVLQRTKAQSYLPSIPNQSRFVKRIFVSERYPIPQEEKGAKRTMVGMGWLTCSIHEQEELLALCVLDHVLMGNDAALLKEPLLQSGLCQQASAYLETEMSENPYVLTCRGCEEGAGPLLEKFVHKTLKEVVEKEIPQELIEGAIHQLELYRSEITGDRYPYGLSLFFRSMLLRQHGGHPEDGLRIHALFSQLRKRCEDASYLKDLIKKYWVENTHFVCLTMEPDAALAEEESAQERAVLDEIRQTLSAEKEGALVEQAKQLESFQKEQEAENLEVLPKVTLEDVSQASLDFPLQRERVGSLEVFTHSCFTNHIVYADCVFDLADVPSTQLPFVRLFSLFLTQLGCGGRDYRKNLEYIQLHTGGIGASLALNRLARDPHEYHPSFHLVGKALERKADKLFPLFREVLLSADFSDRERMRELLLQHWTGMQSSLVSNALRYAVNLAASAFSTASRTANTWHGLEYYQAIKELVENLDSRLDEVIGYCEGFKQHLLDKTSPHLVLSCGEESYRFCKENQFWGLTEWETSSFSPWKEVVEPLKIKRRGCVVASPVSFTCCLLPSVSFSHPDAALLNIAARLFNNGTLHRRIREQGGAYGGGAVSNTSAGHFYFFGYRDPHIQRSMQAFDEAIRRVSEGNFNERELEEAKLGVLQGLDSPVSPGSRASVAYTWWREGKDLALRQGFRERLLKATIQEVSQAVQEQIQPVYAESKTVAFCSRELLEKENQKLQNAGEAPFEVCSV